MHGIKTNVLTEGTRPIAALATGVIGLVATATKRASDADGSIFNAAFPLGEPVLVTNVRKAIEVLGPVGTLRTSLEAIADQCSPYVIVVRVGIDEVPEDQETLTQAGIAKLLIAEQRTGMRPRVLGAPGLDTQAVVADLVIAAKKLRAMVYAGAIGDDIAEVATYAENFGDRELMLIWPEWTGDVPGDAVARALGLRALIDETQGWHKSLSNVAVGGVTGISEDLFFDIQDETTDVATLNDALVTTLVRSPAGGFVYWGNRTTSSEPLFSFEPATRTSQILQDEIAAGLVWANDKPLTKFLIKDVLETINARLRSLVTQGRVIGARAWFDPALNDEVDLAAGKLTIDYDFTPAAPLEGLTLNQRITDRYYADLAAELAA